MSDTWEKFQGATLSLAQEGSLKDRLNHAYRNYLVHVEEHELPGEMREEFRNVQSLLTRDPPLVRGDDAVRATIRKMSSAEAQRVAAAVVHMFGCIPRPRGATVATRPSTAQVVPLFAAEA